VLTNRGRNLLGWAGAILLLGSLASTAAARNNFDCTVVDENGNPIQDGEMILTEVRNGRERDEETNDDGRVEFRGLDDGAYRLRGNVEGYIVSDSPPMEISGDITKQCDYTLVSVNHANAMLQRVQTLTRQRNLEEAEAEGLKVVEMMPDEASAHFVLSVAYATGGKEQEAIAAIEKAAELNPAQFQGRVQLVTLSAMSTVADQLVANNDFDAAIQKYEEMIELNPAEPLVYYNMAVAYGRANKFSEALTAIDKAIALNPGDAEMLQMKTRLEEMFMNSLNQELEAP